MVGPRDEGSAGSRDEGVNYVSPVAGADAAISAWPADECSKASGQELMGEEEKFRGARTHGDANVPRGRDSRFLSASRRTPCPRLSRRLVGISAWMLSKAVADAVV